MTVPINERSAAALVATADPQAKELADSTPAQARAAAAKWLAFMGAPEDVAEVAHTFIPGPTADLPVTIYRPAFAGSLPAIVAFHGGGWVVGNIELADRPHRALANATGCVVVAVNYQKAPEHPYPEPLNDCVAAFDWVVDNSGSLGVDPARIGVSGESAGGNLAAAVALYARDRGLAQPAFQLLIYPALDPQLTSPSARSHATGYGLTTADMVWFWSQYLAAPQARSDPYAAPILAQDHSGLAPAVVVTAEFDPLRDDGRRYAELLTAAGVPVIAHDYQGSIHGFLWMATAVDEYRRLLDDLARNLRELLHRASPDRPT